jgi:hypothetical protein
VLALQERDILNKPGGKLELDLLEDAGIPPPKPPIITDDDRAALASMALAQRQFYFVCAFFVGLVGGAAIAYYLGYHDVVFTIFKWAISGTGIALILSALNISKLYSFKCPRCDGNYFWGAPGGIFSKQCGTCGLPLNLPEGVDLTP